MVIDLSIDEVILVRDILHYRACQSALLNKDKISIIRVIERLQVALDEEFDEIENSTDPISDQEIELLLGARTQV